MHRKSPYIIISQQTPTPYKINKLIELMIRIKLNQTILMPGFSYFLGNMTINFCMFGDMFPQSHSFVTMADTSHIKDTCSNLSLSNNWLRDTKLFDLFISTATKPRLSGNMLPNINTCEN